MRTFIGYEGIFQEVEEMNDCKNWKKKKNNEASKPDGITIKRLKTSCKKRMIYNINSDIGRTSMYPKDMFLY